MSDVVPARRLTLREARESPCMSCATSPCCTHLPLHTFQVRTLRDLDHAIYLLNFDRIVVGLAPSGDWSVYYRYPCRFLDRRDPGNALCTIHGQPLQPQICVHYSPFTCWYRRALTPSVSGEFLTIDRARMDVLLEHVRFDDHRTIVETPSWEEMIALLAEVPLADGFDGPPEEDPAFDAWLYETASGGRPPALPTRRRYEEFLDACSGCSAYCCKTLVFPYGRPQHRRNLDYLQFALGFPGVELGVSDGEWQIVVRARCRHLTADDRCGVFGRPERPSICRYYDASACTYVVQFGQPRPRGYLRVRLEQFFWMTEALRFDDDGALLELPPTDALRETIEGRWIEAVATADPAGADGDDGDDGDDGVDDAAGAPAGTVPAAPPVRRISLPVVAAADRAAPPATSAPTASSVIEPPFGFPLDPRPRP